MDVTIGLDLIRGCENHTVYRMVDLLTAVTIYATNVAVVTAAYSYIYGYDSRSKSNLN